EELEHFFEQVDKQVLAQNTFFRWLLSVIYPRG
ncbi:MAG: hypothetical protein ACJAZ0_001555, partial [Halioglobus sp.]